jgi:predicted DNA binding CopG/RHH family protein
MLLRVSPDLFAAIKEEAADSDLTMRQIILNVLEANLTEGASA